MSDRTSDASLPFQLRLKPAPNKTMLFIRSTLGRVNQQSASYEAMQIGIPAILKRPLYNLNARLVHLQALVERRMTMRAIPTGLPVAAGSLRSRHPLNGLKFPSFPQIDFK